MLIKCIYFVLDVAKQAQVLFDSDGYTSIVQTTKLKGYRILQEKERCLFSHKSNLEYKCEILKLSGKYFPFIR